MKFAVFVDAENVSSEILKEVHNILRKRGKVISIKVFGDFSTLPSWRDACIRVNAEPVMVWRKSGKNSSDIKMCQACVHMLYSHEGIEHYVLVTGDGDFTHLVQDLKQREKHVIVMGNSASSSNSLRECCDEFIEWPRVKTHVDTLKQTIDSILKEEVDINIGPLKQKLLLLDPTFTEVNYGQSCFRQLLEYLEYDVYMKNGGAFVSMY